MDTGAVLMIAIGLAMYALAAVFATGFERRDRDRPRRRLRRPLLPLTRRRSDARGRSDALEPDPGDLGPRARHEQRSSHRLLRLVKRCTGFERRNASVAEPEQD
jgi:hypothetical protein